VSRDLEPLKALFERFGVDPATEQPFPNDGWSGAILTRLRGRDGRAFVLKRNTWERDWIARSTADSTMSVLREVLFAAFGPPLPWPVRASALGAGYDAATGEQAILMPDLTGVLFDWNRAITIDELDVVLDGLTSLHSIPTEDAEARVMGMGTWWEERIALISRRSLERPGPARDAVAERILPGWDAWDRVATRPVRAIVDSLAADLQPLLDALSAEPSTLLHGDLKLANVGIGRDGAVELIDWQMVMVAPVAIELGWFLVSNVNVLPLPPGDVLDRYWQRRGIDGARQNDIAILIGLLLRGWRKGYDAEAGITHASGMTAADDLAWWCDRAVEAAGRVL
jgi:aminoglycoside phosphotransferase (APT) family kinase protein